jgi:hypothetical protein
MLAPALLLKNGSIVSLLDVVDDVLALALLFFACPFPFPSFNPSIGLKELF